MATRQSSINLLALFTIMGGSALLVESTLAQEEPMPNVASAANPEVRIAVPAAIAILSEPQPATTVSEWQAQIQETLVQITAIRVESTATGLQVVLESDGVLATPNQSVSGNALVLDIPNATLTEDFQTFEPTDGIALIQATTLPGDIVQVAITGEAAVPMVDINSDVAGLILGVTPGVAQAGEEDEAIQVVVTGEQDSYVVPNATTGTRTDTALRDIPQSIQVVPQAVLEDQGVLRLNDALRNVSGVITRNNTTSQTFTVRGFGSSSILRDGFQAVTGNNAVTGYLELGNVERVEVLKGPASILFGQGEPGGVINLVTEQPLREPAYEFGLRLGNRGLVEPSLDLTGPLTEDGRVAYRLNALVRREDYHRDFNTLFTRTFIAPSISIALGENTDLIVDLEYREQERPNDSGLVAIGNGVADIPFDRALTSQELTASTEALRTGYRFEHRFSDNWKIRNAFYSSVLDAESFNNFAGLIPFATFFDETTGFLRILPVRISRRADDLELQTNVVGEFTTGPIEHTLLFGVDLFRQDVTTDTDADFTLFNPFIINGLNVFNPDYDSLVIPDFDDVDIIRVTDRVTAEGLGVYVQDQIRLSDNLILLAGIRYDTISQEFVMEESPLTPSVETSSSSDAFSPRLGLVYQPTEAISLYGSYSRSFVPNTGRTADGNILEPERGEQFEVGVRAELLEGNLVANLAFFDIDKENVAVADPAGNGFFIAAAGQSSRGIELDVLGEILPGWNVVANYAYLDTEVTASDDGTTGNDLFNVPEHNFNLWTNYEIQTGSLEGLSFGLGFNFVDERFGNLANDFTVDSYFLTNAAISYQRDNWRAGFNFRNLFDVDYIESTANSRTGGINPGESFTVIGSFSVEF
ncbi:MAG: TonB-dependent siderophore receptor [Cyanobacteria bacterium P01_H01_bin.58]